LYLGFFLTGLVRSGVAPDHPEVKSVQNDFMEVASDPRSNFLGNVKVGRDLSLKELSNYYNGVVLAYGAAADRTLNIPNESLKQIIPARSFVAWYNGHPDYKDFRPNLATENVIIIGQGNVAIDCARILTKTYEELKHTDIATHALEALRHSNIKRVYVIGRRGHVQAAFTMKELREITRLQDAVCFVKKSELDKGLTPSSLEEINNSRAKKRMNEFLYEQSKVVEEKISKNELNANSKELHLRFLLNPSEFVEDKEIHGAVGGLVCDSTSLSGPAEDQKALPTGEKEFIPAGMILRSIGYKSTPIEGVPFDEKR
jgi:adrenodoxin-NADP+ reductase